MIPEITSFVFPRHNKHYILVSWYCLLFFSFPDAKCTKKEQEVVQVCLPVLSILVKLDCLFSINFNASTVICQSPHNQVLPYCSISTCKDGTGNHSLMGNTFVSKVRRPRFDLRPGRNLKQVPVLPVPPFTTQQVGSQWPDDWLSKEQSRG